MDKDKYPPVLDVMMANVFIRYTFVLMMGFLAGGQWLVSSLGMLRNSGATSIPFDGLLSVSVFGLVVGTVVFLSRCYLTRGQFWVATGAFLVCFLCIGPLSAQMLRSQELVEPVVTPVLWIWLAFHALYIPAFYLGIGLLTYSGVVLARLAIKLWPPTV